MPKVGRPNGSYGPKKKYKTKVTAVVADANDAWRNRTIAAIENLLDAASAQGFAVADIFLLGGSVMRFEVGATKPKEDIEDVLASASGPKPSALPYEVALFPCGGRRTRAPMACCGSVGTRHKVGCHAGLAPSPKTEGETATKTEHKCDDCGYTFNPDPDDYGTVQCPECQSYNSTPIDEIPKV